MTDALGSHLRVFAAIEATAEGTPAAERFDWVLQGWTFSPDRVDSDITHVRWSVQHPRSACAQEAANAQKLQHDFEMGRKFSVFRKLKMAIWERVRLFLVQRYSSGTAARLSIFRAPTRALGHRIQLTTTERFEWTRV